MNTSKVWNAALNSEQEYPLLLLDVRENDTAFDMSVPGDLQMTCPFDGNSTGSSYSASDSLSELSSHYATGSVRFNVHVGHLVWTSLFLRLHNHVRDVIAQEKPGMTHQEVSCRSINFACRWYAADAALLSNAASCPHGAADSIRSKQAV